MKEIIKKALENINEMQQKISKLKIEDLNLVGRFEVEINTINHANKQNLVKEFKLVEKALRLKNNDGIIYTVTLKKDFEVSEINALFLAEKNSKTSAYKLSKANDLKDSSSFYVGSSKLKNIKTRTFNHLGLGSKGVYSLHMSQWLPNIKTENTVVFEYYSLNTADDQMILEAIEQALWDIKKPMFGKRSGLL